MANAYNIKITTSALNTFADTISGLSLGTNNLDAVDVVTLNDAATAIASGTGDGSGASKGARSSARSVVGRLADHIDAARAEIATANAPAPAPARAKVTKAKAKDAATIAKKARKAKARAAANITATAATAALPVTDGATTVVWCDNRDASKAIRAIMSASSAEYAGRESNKFELLESRDGISIAKAYRASRARFVVASTVADVTTATTGTAGLTIAAFDGIDPASYGVVGSAECVTFDGRTHSHTVIARIAAAAAAKADAAATADNADADNADA